MRSRKLAAVVGAGTTLAIVGAIGADAPASCPYDCADQNGIVDTVDCLELLSQWGEVGSTCDMEGDGVDLIDFLSLISNWGPCP